MKMTKVFRSPHLSMFAGHPFIMDIRKPAVNSLSSSSKDYRNDTLMSADYKAELKPISDKVLQNLGIIFLPDHFPRQKFVKIFPKIEIPKGELYTKVSIWRNKIRC